MMKMLRQAVAILTVAGLLGTVWSGWAAEGKDAPKPKPYPLDTCVVSGQKLGTMGEPYVFVHGDREIKLCCKGCLKAFTNAPAKYIKKLEAAERQAR